MRRGKRSKRCVRKLRTRLGRVILEIERGDKDKVYSVHEPEVACIAKGKAGRKYESGQKVSAAVTSKGGWLRERCACRAIPTTDTR